ncbi:response regulator transcription factor [Streptomyces sp. CNQ085]|uniref:response regulator transcription factor n=1 Tax=Streptomyces sp. CNQ085 TaxID=2886944 RepID=UPI001F511A1B|nr:response regulator transcription factor [Streptomyces sp. CNQ085]MCI0385833.1 response regulator transcription factor [Streptomyces sp. CNQ085]
MDRSGGTGPRVSVVLEDVVQRYGIEAMIRLTVTDAPVHCFATGEEAVANLPAASPDLLILAAGEADRNWPAGAVEKLSGRGTRFLILVEGSDEQDVARAARLCGQGYVDRQDLNTRSLTGAVTDVLQGKLYVSVTLARSLLGRAGKTRPALPDMRGAALTPRELQVLDLLAKGLSNKQVARRLAISEHGVKRLVSNVLAKLNCPNRTMAVVRAMEEGLLVS